jgi:hypothetical protein
LLTTVGSALFLAEVLTPLQTLGGAVMLAALGCFRRTATLHGTINNTTLGLSVGTV